MIDTDRDGLPDCWETDGIPYIDENGNDRVFVLDADGDGVSDANPYHKNLFVELDEDGSAVFDPAALALVIDAFDNAPVDNPDGETGIDLCVLRDDSGLPLPTYWPTTNGWPTDFDTIRAEWFGTIDERAAASQGSGVVDAKTRAFRYAITAEYLDRRVLGVAEGAPSDDFIVCALEDRFNDGEHDVEDLAGAWMHELGHCLGLLHGGDDNIQGKVNYPSIMNYMHTVKWGFNDAFWALDYSRAGPEVFPRLNELSLDETVGIPSGGMYDHWTAAYGVADADGHRKIEYARLDGSRTDFGEYPLHNGQQDGEHHTEVIQDLNYMSDDAPFPGVTKKEHTSHRPFNDWDGLQYGVTDATGDATELRAGELTHEAVDWIEQNFPPPPCAADFNGDGIVNTLDVLAFLNAWNADDPDADFNGDGTINTLDVLAFLNAWTAGC